MRKVCCSWISVLFSLLVLGIFVLDQSITHYMAFINFHCSSMSLHTCSKWASAYPLINLLVLIYSLVFQLSGNAYPFACHMQERILYGFIMRIRGKHWDWYVKANQLNYKSNINLCCWIYAIIREQEWDQWEVNKWRFLAFYWIMSNVNICM